MFNKFAAYAIILTTAFATFGGLAYFLGAAVSNNMIFAGLAGFAAIALTVTMIKNIIDLGKLKFKLQKGLSH